ncbi:hypothetical protein C2W62_49975, partial [Candidatus Entotheonella serta]
MRSIIFFRMSDTTSFQLILPLFLECVPMHTTTEQKTFLGPVFIVGMPRSGTTLMRALLNQHPRVSLALTESH